MSSLLETHLAKLESLIATQNRRIEDQNALIYTLSQRNDHFANELARLSTADRLHTRSIHRLSEKVFTDGEWIETGTSVKRWAAEQNWKKGDEGPLSWEWMRHSRRPAFSPFLNLPEELVAMILQACTLDSLASLSSVSMHFLRRTSPLIYKEITVDGKLAARLFCERNPEDQYRNRRIHPFLSFENTRKITLDNGVRLALHHKTLEVSIGRFSSKTLNLDSIAFRSTQPTHDLHFWTPLLSILNPYHIKLYGAQNDQFRFPKVIPLPLTGAPFLDSWTRLESVTSIGEIVFTNTDGSLALLPNRPAGTPGPGRRARHVEYQIHQAPPKGEGTKTIEVLDPEKVLEVMRDRYTPQVGLWTYLRAVMVETEPAVDPDLSTTPKSKSRKKGRRKGGR
ncbi:hypothetical protein BDY24DRAFT_91870 [Mrakia frigida]|uniref:uncharacterized protein n=1 Tax=Mrakia frigida TaxID=29902 RepID=UPI003FCC09FF